MRFISWLLRLIIFVVLVHFSMINSDKVTLHYYQDQSLELPLSVALLVFFSMGVLLTMITASRKTTSKK